MGRSLDSSAFFKHFREFKTSLGQYFDFLISTRNDKDNQSKFFSMQKIKKIKKKSLNNLLIYMKVRVCRIPGINIPIWGEY